MHDPWLVRGDFNTILYASEKHGVLQTEIGCKLNDLHFKGPRFTWAQSSLLKRLDRAVSNEAWLHKFPNSSVLYMPKVKSDHSLVLVRFSKKEIQSGSAMPFRFLAAWLTNKDFANFFAFN